VSWSADGKAGQGGKASAPVGASPPVVLMHLHAGRSLLGMSQSVGADRKTIRKYIAPAVAAGIVPGGPARSEVEWQELVRGWFPELATRGCGR
jgi:hypothetical protein